MKHTAIRILMALVAIFGVATASAQTPMTGGDSKKVMQTITKQYGDWQTVALEGKVSMDRLPLSPTVKIFMRKGSEVTISVRAPFVGEVGRAQIKGDSVFAVNKLKKVYLKERLGDFFTDLPVTLGDIQNILLARAFVAGSGQLSSKNYTKCDFYSAPDAWLVVPKEPIGGTVNYGFQFDTQGRLTLATAVPDDTAIVATCEYSYSGKKTNMDIDLTYGQKQYQATLSLGQPSYGAKPMDDFKIDKKYKKVGIKEFMKAF